MVQRCVVEASPPVPMELSSQYVSTSTKFYQAVRCGGRGASSCLAEAPPASSPWTLYLQSSDPAPWPSRSTLTPYVPDPDSWSSRPWSHASSRYASRCAAPRPISCCSSAGCPTTSSYVAVGPGPISATQPQASAILRQTKSGPSYQYLCGAYAPTSSRQRRRHWVLLCWRRRLGFW